MASIAEVRAALEQASEILRESYRNVRSAQEGLDEAVVIHPAGRQVCTTGCRGFCDCSYTVSQGASAALN